MQLVTCGNNLDIRVHHEVWDWIGVKIPYWSHVLSVIGKHIRFLWTIGVVMFYLYVTYNILSFYAIYMHMYKNNSLYLWIHTKCQYLIGNTIMIPRTWTLSYCHWYIVPTEPSFDHDQKLAKNMTMSTLCMSQERPYPRRSFQNANLGATLGSLKSFGQETTPVNYLTFQVLPVVRTRKKKNLKKPSLLARHLPMKLNMGCF